MREHDYNQPIKTHENTPLSDVLDAGHTHSARYREQTT
jgi:hypothetical protein